MIYAVIALAVTNIVTLVLFIRARQLNTGLSKNSHAVRQWLSIHQKLQRASGTMVILKAVDEDSIFFREPSR